MRCAYYCEEDGSMSIGGRVRLPVYHGGEKSGTVRQGQAGRPKFGGQRGERRTEITDEDRSQRRVNRLLLPDFLDFFVFRSPGGRTVF